jgi:hypothetical protein
MAAAIPTGRMASRNIKKEGNATTALRKVCFKGLKIHLRKAFLFWTTRSARSSRIKMGMP